QMLYENDLKERINNNLRLIRNIYQRILEKCAEIIPGMKNDCMNQNNIILGQKTIDWLSRKNITNSIIRSFFFSVNAIPSNFSNHPNIENATTDTVNSLIYALKDIIVWFGQICKKHK
ncbi:hypothetical protein QUF70_20295, partial [Desulfobacterales bacterium HSG17]|nr:hypothetical protein [Desulfobacterales bacterium HSG17]